MSLESKSVNFYFKFFFIKLRFVSGSNLSLLSAGCSPAGKAIIDVVQACSYLIYVWVKKDGINSSWVDQKKRLLNEIKKQRQYT